MGSMKRLIIAKTLDALNGVAWKDDSQIVCGIVRKHYAESPGLVITIKEEKSDG